MKGQNKMLKLFKKQKPKPPEVGQFFHTHAPDGSIETQGRIVQNIGCGLVRVELFSFTNGQAKHDAARRVSDMTNYTFYNSADEMQRAYEAAKEKT